MSYTVSVVLNVFLIIVEACSFIIIAGSFFKTKRRIGIVILAYALTLLLNVLFVVLFEGSVIKSIALVVLYSALLFFCYSSATLVKSFFVSLFWLGYLEICDTALASLVSYLFHAPLDQLMQSPEAYYFLLFSVKTIELFGVIVLHALTKKRLSTKAMSSYAWLRSLFIPFSCLILSILEFRMYSLVPSYVRELLLSSIILLLVEFSSVFLLNYLDRQAQASYDNAILRQNMKAQTDNIAAWKDAYTGLRKQSHDIDNHMVTIQGLVKNNAPKEQILNYLDTLRGSNMPDLLSAKTNRLSADIILSQKIAIAKSKDIKLDLYVDDLSVLPLSDDELVTVLSNLIDNAIEAVEKIQDAARRIITIKLRSENDVFFIFCENPTATPVEIQENRVLTTKKQPANHGYGTQNIIKVLEDHNDIYSFAFDKEKMLFSFSAQLN